jgi:hypothetical protein
MLILQSNLEYVFSPTDESHALALAAVEYHYTLYKVIFATQTIAIHRSQFVQSTHHQAQSIAGLPGGLGPEVSELGFA